MKRLAVLNVVGLTDSLIGSATPQLAALRAQGGWRPLRPAFPAVTCTAQSNYLTGRNPSAHGIVANGWYHRELAEVQFWKQSNHLVAGPKVWDTLRQQHPHFTCAKLFWWYNMYSTADFSITPRPLYPADGRKVFDIHTWPYSIRHDIKRDLGEFPFPGFWGPAAGVDSPQGPADAASRWIAASAKWIEERHQPTLSLIYLPHLDYSLQRLGPCHPDIPRDLGRIDAIVGDLTAFFQQRSVRVMILSEYGIAPVSRPVHLNRLFRRHGWITVKDELGLESLDCGASRVFAVADHQVAHIYLNDPSLAFAVRDAVMAEPGVETVLDRDGKAANGLDHPRSGDLVAVARPDSWFTYYYWLNDRLAPDFARTVDIHRKAGYDPVELFLDPTLRAVKLRILWRLLQKRLGFRMLMDVVPLEAGLVKGSHGRRTENPGESPLVLAGDASLLPPGPVDSTAVHDLILRAVDAG